MKVIKRYNQYRRLEHRNGEDPISDATIRRIFKLTNVILKAGYVQAEEEDGFAA